MPITQERMKEVLEAGESYKRAWDEEGALLDDLLGRITQGELQAYDALMSLSRFHSSAMASVESAVVLRLERELYERTKTRNRNYKERQRREREGTQERTRAVLAEALGFEDEEVYEPGEEEIV